MIRASLFVSVVATSHMQMHISLALHTPTTHAIVYRVSLLYLVSLGARHLGLGYALYRFLITYKI